MSMAVFILEDFKKRAKVTKMKSFNFRHFRHMGKNYGYKRNYHDTS